MDWSICTLVTVETVITHTGPNTHHPLMELYSTVEASNYETPVNNTTQDNLYVR